jgi:ubiquinone/menaquinone biosynthesis C-methylase UbiE
MTLPLQHNRQPEWNLDPETVSAFGEEWSHYDQSEVHEELHELFLRYFAIFPWISLPPDAQGFDLGCGSGRWARFAAPRVGHLHCIDASEQAINVARRNLATFENCSFHHASVDSIPLADDSMDFGYSLGVLHHVPDTEAGIRSCVAKLKPGAPFLVYLYYALDHRPWWFRSAWRASDAVRSRISVLRHSRKVWITRGIAATVYYPVARAALLLEKAGLRVDSIPLSFYRHQSFYTMCTDALDRFGTRLEQRFTRDQIRAMMEEAGLRDISFSDTEPYWCAVGYRHAGEWASP